MRQLFYYKMREAFCYKMRQLLQNPTFITKCTDTIIVTVSVRLTHFFPVLCPLKTQKNGFLVFSGVIKWVLCSEIG